MNFRLDVDWGTACLDPGESVSFSFDWICGDEFAPCNTPAIECFQWTLTGAPIGPCATPTPSPTATPSPHGDPFAHPHTYRNPGGRP
jgi:hypothetical protein